MSAYGLTVTLLATQLAEAVLKDEAPEEGGFDLSAGLFGKHVSDWIRSVAKELDDRASSAMVPPGYVVVPVVPTEEQWGGLARDIIMWLDMTSRPTAGSLFTHLERMGRDIPQWLRDEPEMRHLDHVPSKGTRATIIYRAMVEAATKSIATEADTTRATGPKVCGNCGQPAPGCGGLFKGDGKACEFHGS